MQLPKFGQGSLASSIWFSPWKELPKVNVCVRLHRSRQLNVWQGRFHRRYMWVGTWQLRRTTRLKLLKREGHGLDDHAQCALGQAVALKSL